MPLLDIINRDGTLNELATLYLVSKMLHGNDEQRSNALISSAIIFASKMVKDEQWHQDLIDKELGHNREISTSESNVLINNMAERSVFNAACEMLIPYGGISTVHSACEAYPFLTKESTAQANKGFIVAKIIQAVLYMDEMQPPASINKAVFICEEVIKKLTIKDDWVLGKSDRVIWSAWKELKSVAHLWGASFVMQPFALTGNPLIWYEDEDYIPAFLNTAKYVQDKLLSLRPQGQKTTILDRNEIWELPTNYPYADIDIIRSDYHGFGEILKKYRAPKRIV